MRTFLYPGNKEIYVTEESVEKVATTFHPTKGIYEPESIDYFYSLVERKHSNKNAVIIDIGAQSGLYSLYAKYLPECMFYAFEPFELTYSILIDNLNLNNITNVKTFNCALGSINETKKLHVPEHLGLNTLGNTPMRFSSWNDYEVKVNKLDDMLFNNLSSVDYIKCDTEGWEYHVFKGAEECIQKWKPELFFEINGTNLEQCSMKEEELVDYVKSLDYRFVRRIDNENFHYTYNKV